MTTTETTDRRKPLDRLPDGAEWGVKMPEALATLLVDAVRPAAAMAVTDALTAARANRELRAARDYARVNPWDEVASCGLEAEVTDDVGRARVTAIGYGRDVMRWAVNDLADAAAEAARAAVLTAGERFVEAAGDVSLAACG